MARLRYRFSLGPRRFFRFSPVERAAGLYGRETSGAEARQGQYAILAATGHVLKRCRDLRQVLRLFDRKLIKAVTNT